MSCAATALAPAPRTWVSPRVADVLLLLLLLPLRPPSWLLVCWSAPWLECACQGGIIYGIHKGMQRKNGRAYVPCSAPPPPLPLPKALHCFVLPPALHFSSLARFRFMV